MAGGSSQAGQTSQALQLAGVLRPGSTTTSTAPTTTPTTRAYESLYGRMLPVSQQYYAPTTMRSNYDPAKAQYMADLQHQYAVDTAAANEAGYNRTMQSWQAMKDAQAAAEAAKAAAAKRAAEEAALRNAMAPWMRNMGTSDTSAAQGGLASLQGFEQ